MLQKLWAIISKDVYRTFTDRNLLLLMFATPLAISTIIALAFSDLSGGGAPISDIPVAIVNQDAGSENFNGGQIIVTSLVPDATSEGDNSGLPAGECEAVQTSEDSEDDSNSSNQSLLDLTEAELLDDPAAARQAVDNGDYVAAIIIPADFSESIAISQEDQDFESVQIEVYGNAGSPISSSVIRSIVEGFINQMLTGQIAVAATIDTLIERAQNNPTFGLTFAAQSASGAFEPDFACAFTPAFNTVSVAQQAVQEEDGDEGQPNLIVLFGAAQAAFFALFTASGGATDVLEERRNWTLQRLVISPTRRSIVLLGKLLGVFVTVLAQLVILFIALSLVASMLEGELLLVWGNNWLGLIAMILATALAASGVGMIAAAAASTIEQANIIGSVVALFMGTLGGAFFQVEAIPAIDPLTRLSIVRWGSEGFTKLAQGEGDVLINVAVLLLLGAALFAISLFIFSRRQDV